MPFVAGSGVQRVPPYRMLDAFRGFAAAWVVMVHCCVTYVSTDPGRYLRNPLYAFAIRGQLGVLIFFVISGYCITAAAHSALYSGKPMWRYGYERVRRIFPPYWAALIIGILANLAVAYAVRHVWIPPLHHPQIYENSIRFWIGNASLTQMELGTGMANVVFWSLCYEVAFYAVVGVWLWTAKVVARRHGLANGTRMLILGLSLTTFASLLALIVFGSSPFPFDSWHQFAFGGLLFYIIESNSQTIASYTPRLRWMLNGVGAVSAVLAVLFIVLRQVGEVDISHPSSKLRTTMCLFLCVLFGLLRKYDVNITNAKVMRPLFWLGACSYSLYLIHPVVLPFVETACRRIGLTENRYWIAFFIQFAVAIACGRLFYHLIERHFISSRQVKRLAEEHAS